MFDGTTSVDILVDSETNGRRYARWLPHGFDPRIVDVTATEYKRVTADIAIVDSDVLSGGEIHADHVVWVEPETGDALRERDDKGWITLQKPVGAGPFLAAIERLARREWYVRWLSEYAQDTTEGDIPADRSDEPVVKARTSGALEAVVTEFDGADFRAAFRRISNPSTRFDGLRATDP